MTLPVSDGDASVAAPSSTPTEAKRSRLGTVIWVALAIIVAFFAVGVYLPPHAHRMAVKFLFLWPVGACLGYLGVRVGDAVRRIFKPDVIIVRGGISDAIWARICWAIGPQIVGLYLGAVTGTSIVAGWTA
ncbi:hypothetical protein DBB29_19520 [Pandoraea cepalis]|uniref:Permease n=1 Tax=Pandoraea cepalis TaxID=2508294 RepID=A0AAW7MPQ7_9BURK|nr:hypothetical protein [Pandoraea cepalis]MDN4574795.1 hypothetical protein [Pandoraea cepalis]MDN4580298.1 hypothetical protein [Pandoraea cepalis]